MNNMVEDLPLVSICIPAYNGAAFITAVMQSALQQTYKNIEIIVTDDCSTDTTLITAQKIAAGHRNIYVYSNETNKGLIGNWKNCVAKSNGSWIKFLFQDDVMEPACVEKMLAQCLANNGKAALCARKFIIEAETPAHVKDFFQNKLIKPQQLFKQKQFYGPSDIAVVLAPHLMQNVLGEPSTWLLRKDIFTQMPPFNIRLRQLMDYEFFLLCIMQYGMVFINEELVSFRVHSNSESSKNINDRQLTIATVNRIIQSHTGDYLEIINTLIKYPVMQPLLNKWHGPARLQVLYTKLYYKSVRKYGAEKTNEALQRTLQQTSFTVGKYTFVKYVFNKIKYLLLVKPLLKRKVVL